MLSIESYSSEQQRAVKRVMARLAQLEKMESRRHRGKRQFERASYNSTAILRIEHDDHRAMSEETCTVWTRDISRGGASFICPFEVPGKRVQLGFKVADGTVKWYPAEIVRERQIPDEQFWEYGTVFRVLEPQAPQEASPAAPQEAPQEATQEAPQQEDSQSVPQTVSQGST